LTNLSIKLLQTYQVFERWIHNHRKSAGQHGRAMAGV
jgi:hypothetical protein